jgi:YgiT-type zinc finger domain-containing protein
MKCPQCKHETFVEEKEPMTFRVNPNVIVQNVAVDRCTNCGFESIAEKEYERVRKMVHKVKAPHEATVVLP